MQLSLSEAHDIPQIHNAFSKVAPSPLHKQQNALKAELLQAKSELQATSAQDQFAQWAKLRRKIDKIMADLEATSLFPVLLLLEIGLSA